jgi:hypothetical protein
LNTHADIDSGLPDAKAANPPHSRATKVLKTVGVVGFALWCVGLGLAVGYSYSRPTAPEPSRGRTYTLWRPDRAGGDVYLTKTEYVSLAAIWGAGTILLLMGLQGARRLARISRSPRP